VRIAVLLKPVPDTTGQERLGAHQRVDRSTPAVINPNDEHALEAALRLREARGADDEIVLVTMAPAQAPEKIREGLARGANRAVLVTDDALAGSCTLSTTRVLAAALRGVEADLILAGADTSDGRGGVVGAGIAALLGLPYISYASSVAVDGERVRVERASPSGHDVLGAPLPALVSVTQAVGEARYPTLKGIMGARSKPIETRALGDLGLDPATVGGAAATTRVLATRQPPERGATVVVTAPPPDAAAQVVAFLADRRAI
jgi:electron transfer flavoprotein beta subunit